MIDQILTERFQGIFDRQHTVEVKAPGRVNLIGEHTDYNQGFVFPAAINYATKILAAPRNDRIIKVMAVDFDNQLNTFSLDDIQFEPNCGWSNYVRGVVKMLSEVAPLSTGADLLVTGDVPQGAGLSSSASFEIALLKCFSLLYSLDLKGVNAAQIGQRAENDFVGCSCGIMDQLISAMGKKDHAMLLDCRSLEFQHTQINESLQILIVNSNVKRGLVDSEYNLRREQCEQASRLLGVDSLRDADMDLLRSHKLTMPEAVYRRARHIITENQRTLNMFNALQKDDVAKVSQLMAESHISMRDDFEITVPQIDFLVEQIRSVIGERGGVRMTGGGFGGCVVALVPRDLVADVRAVVEREYQRKTGLKESIYLCSAEQGAFI